MLELTIHESFPLKDNDKYIDIVASVAKQCGNSSVDVPATLHFDFYCANMCDEPHRISADAHRWVIGALVVSGVLPSCRWKYVKGFVDTFHIDEKDNRVVVRII